MSGRSGPTLQTRIDADFLLNGVIREALAELELRIWRADEDSQPGMITDKVISDIYDCDLVIADLSELNANVFYELGIRHAAAKPTVHICSVGTKLPFDNLGHRVIFFDKGNWGSVLDARRRLRAQAEEALADQFVVSNPVTQAITAKAFQASASSSDQVVGNLLQRVDELEVRVSNRALQAVDRTSSPEISRAPLLATLDRAVAQKIERISTLKEIAVRLSAENRFSDSTIRAFSESNSSLTEYTQIIDAIEKGNVELCNEQAFRK